MLVNPLFPVLVTKRIHRRGKGKKKVAPVTLETIILIKNQWDPIMSGRTLTQFKMYWTPMPSQVTEAHHRSWQLWQERRHFDWLLWLDSEPLPPSHYRHLVLIVSFPSMLSVKLRAREDARNEDYPPSDRVVIRKKRAPAEIVIRKGHRLQETSSNLKCLAGLGRSPP